MLRLEVGRYREQLVAAEIHTRASAETAATVEAVGRLVDGLRSLNRDWLDKQTAAADMLTSAPAGWAIMRRPPSRWSRCCSIRRLKFARRARPCSRLTWQPRASNERQKAARADRNAAGSRPCAARPHAGPARDAATAGEALESYGPVVQARSIDGPAQPHRPGSAARQLVAPTTRSGRGRSAPW